VAAQIGVHDAAVTLRNSITAAVKELMVRTQIDQHGTLRRMARRLSAHTNLDKYAVQDVPRWRTHDFETYFYANNYHAALNYGDALGAAYQGVTQQMLSAGDVMRRLSAPAQRALVARLATVEAADATAIAATHNSGSLRYNGRRELAAIDALETDVIDPSLEQSTTAVLDKISGAVLIGARQRQARAQLVAAVVEQLLVDNKRARDTETTAINMQLVTWRDAHVANEAFVSGSADALRTWRQP